MDEWGDAFMAAPTQTQGMKHRRGDDDNAIEADKNILSKALILTIKQVIMNTQDARMLKGMLLRVWQIDSKCILGARMSEQTVAYNTATQGKSGHGQGPPDAWAWKGMIRGAIEGDNPALRDAVSVLMAHWQQATQKQVLKNLSIQN